MSATVPETRVDLSQDEALISLGVRAVTWQHAVRLHNWIAGRPAVLVPCTVPRDAVTQGSTAEYPFWVKPRYQDVGLLYSLYLTAETECQASISINGSSVGTGFRIQNQRNAAWFSFVQQLASQSTTEQELVFSVTATGGTVSVDGLMVEALPRSLLALDANDLGADRAKLGIRQPISERTFAVNLLDNQNALRDATRRTGFHHSWGTLNPFTTTSASYTGLFEDTISVLGRKLYSSDTTRPMAWRVKGYATDGTTSAKVRITNKAGTSVIAMAAGTTSATWLPKVVLPGESVSVDAEDNTTPSGIRGGTPDDHTFEVQRTAGAGTVKIVTVSQMET